ncbi:aromatic prenyltransferase [Actinacidiphila rubida]|uniref:Aromatic prenyltransferase Orf2 n=1 Tax=Actinacidiphila rubida TaxID=310780 RepID=A0A1H8E812_9ACTN|nr:aromatic prenyltransferase [Actinacidiphila rubida]SEN15540.1 Aromatic prenyltransferase Orf2 [Actinacidiphila rubida]
MSANLGIEEAYSAVEEASGLLGVPCSREGLWPVLSAFTPFEGGFIFSATAGERGGDLDLTIQVPAGITDPYAHAVSHGLVPGTDHPVASLLPDLRKACSVDECLIDVGVSGGFNKVYAHFPHDVQRISRLARLPSMPGALAGNADYFDRHGLEHVAMVAIDYRSHTTNLYVPTPGGLAPDTIRSLVRGLGLPEPEPELVESARATFRVYFTLGWDSPAIRRISFARPLDLPLIRAREPEFTRFMTGTPYTYDGDRFSISIVKWSPEGVWFNGGSYYRFGPLQVELFRAFLDQRA